MSVCELSIHSLRGRNGGGGGDDDDDDPRMSSFHAETKLLNSLAADFNIVRSLTAGVLPARHA